MNNSQYITWVDGQLLLYLYFFILKITKKLWEWILLHQSVDRGFEKSYAILFGQFWILRRFFGLFFKIFLHTWVTIILLILEGWFLLSFVPHIDSKNQFNRFLIPFLFSFYLRKCVFPHKLHYNAIHVRLM